MYCCICIYVSLSLLTLLPPVYVYVMCRYVVCAIHHCDGSSSKAPTHSGPAILYEHPVSYSDYDPEFRPNQIQKREKELFEMKQFILEGIIGYCVAAMRLLLLYLGCDWNWMIVAVCMYRCIISLHT